MNNDELYQVFLTKVYPHTLEKCAGDTTQNLMQQGICPIYGELYYPSVKKIIQEFALTTADIFLDLGSGLGKCALQVFMQSNVGKVVGIEAMATLYAQAQSAMQRVKTDFPYFWIERDLIFSCANFLEASWHDATAVYTCSTCFTPALLTAIGDKINQQSCVQKVMSLRPLPTLQLPLKKVFRVECSWDSALCFYYTRRQ